MKFLTAGSQILKSPDTEGEIFANLAETRDIE